MKYEKDPFGGGGMLLRIAREKRYWLPPVCPSVCVSVSVCPRELALLPLDGSSEKVILRTVVRNSVQKIHVCLKSDKNTFFFFVLLTVLHLSIFISAINQLDAQNSCFIISLFHATTCFEHCSAHHQEVKICIIQHLISSHWNKWVV